VGKSVFMLVLLKFYVQWEKRCREIIEPKCRCRIPSVVFVLVLAQQTKCSLPENFWETLRICRGCLCLFCLSQESLWSSHSREILASSAWVRCWRPPVTGCQVIYSCSEACVRVRGLNRGRSQSGEWSWGRKARSLLPNFWRQLFNVKLILSWTREDDESIKETILDPLLFFRLTLLFTVDVGLRQGCVLSTLPYTVYMNGIHSYNRVDEGVVSTRCRWWKLHDQSFDFYGRFWCCLNSRNGVFSSSMHFFGLQLRGIKLEWKLALRVVTVFVSRNRSQCALKVSGSSLQ